MNKIFFLAGPPYTLKPGPNRLSCSWASSCCLHCHFFSIKIGIFFALAFLDLCNFVHSLPSFALCFAHKHVHGSHKAQKHLKLVTVFRWLNHVFWLNFSKTIAALLSPSMLKHVCSYSYEYTFKQCSRACSFSLHLALHSNRGSYLIFCKLLGIGCPLFDNIYNMLWCISCTFIYFIFCLW